MLIPLLVFEENLETLFPVVGCIETNQVHYITVGRSENRMVVVRKEGFLNLWFRCLQVSSLHFVNLSFESTNGCQLQSCKLSFLVKTIKSWVNMLNNVSSKKINDLQSCAKKTFYCHFVLTLRDSNSLILICTLQDCKLLILELSCYDLLKQMPYLDPSI